MASILPNQTIYLQNLNDKVKKPDLKRHLYSLLCQYGRIVDVFVSKAPAMRGQAFVTFQELSSANMALRSLQGYPFFGKSMKIQYAKRKSRIFAHDRAAAEPPGLAQIAHAGNEIELEASEEASLAMPHPALLTIDSSAAATAEVGGSENHILFLDNLPLDTTEGVLVLVFQSCPGYREVRLIPGHQERKAFVEFASVEQAASAMSILNGYRVSSTHQLTISYAKK